MAGCSETHCCLLPHPPRIRDALARPHQRAPEHSADGRPPTVPGAHPWAAPAPGGQRACRRRLDGAVGARAPAGPRRPRGWGPPDAPREAAGSAPRSRPGGPPVARAGPQRRGRAPPNPRGDAASPLPPPSPGSRGRHFPLPRLGGNVATPPRRPGEEAAGSRAPAGLARAAPSSGASQDRSPT